MAPLGTTLSEGRLEPIQLRHTLAARADLTLSAKPGTRLGAFYHL